MPSQPVAPKISKKSSRRSPPQSSPSSGRITPQVASVATDALAAISAAEAVIDAFKGLLAHLRTHHTP